MSAADAATPSDEFDRHRRRVLWALPTGLYLVGSRHGDEVNLMTANLVVQVCMEPKLVGVALERESVTAGLVHAGGGFTVSCSPAPIATWCGDSSSRSPTSSARADGAVLAMSGQPVTEVGPDRLPVLALGGGLPGCRLTSAETLGSHVLCIGEVTEVGGRARRGPAHGGHPHALRRLTGGPGVATQPEATRRAPPAVAGRCAASRSRRPARPRRRRSWRSRRSPLGLLAEALALGALDRGHAARPRPPRPGPGSGPPSLEGRTRAWRSA